LPLAEVEGDMNGLRFGTPEIVRWGMGPEHMPELAALIQRALVGNEDEARIAADVTAFRRRFRQLHYMR
jgi:glycine hydroxymethyltransferase